jgi:hypothetical protein
MSLSMKKVYELVSIICHFLFFFDNLRSLFIAAMSIVRIVLSTSTLSNVNFLCNKPFLYAIRYKQTTLFMGRYVKVIDTGNMPPIIDGGLG